MQHPGPDWQQNLPGGISHNPVRDQSLSGDSFPKEHRLRSLLAMQQGDPDTQHNDTTAQRPGPILQHNGNQLQPVNAKEASPSDDLQPELQGTQHKRRYLTQIKEGWLRSLFDMQQGRACRRQEGVRACLLKHSVLKGRPFLASPVVSTRGGEADHPTATFGKCPIASSTISVGYS